MPSDCWGQQVRSLDVTDLLWWRLFVCLFLLSMSLVKLFELGQDLEPVSASGTFFPSWGHEWPFLWRRDSPSYQTYVNLDQNRKTSSKFAFFYWLRHFIQIQIDFSQYSGHKSELLPIFSSRPPRSSFKDTFLGLNVESISVNNSPSFESLTIFRARSRQSFAINLNQSS